jgi:hypothetical protein
VEDRGSWGFDELVMDIISCGERELIHLIPGLQPDPRCPLALSLTQNVLREKQSRDQEWQSTKHWTT